MRVLLGPIVYLIWLTYIRFAEERLEGALVRVGDQNRIGLAPNAVCGEVKRNDIDRNSVVELECSNTLKGRYLSVSLDLHDYNILTLCEVKAYGGECREGIGYPYFVAWIFFFKIQPSFPEGVATAPKQFSPRTVLKNTQPSGKIAPGTFKFVLYPHLSETNSNLTRG